MKNILRNYPGWKKPGILLIMLLCIGGLTACTAKKLETAGQEPGQIQEQEEPTKELADQPTKAPAEKPAKESVEEPAKETAQEPLTENQTMDKDQGADTEEANQFKNMSQLKELLGLSKEELIKRINSEYATVDEGGLEFTKPEIRVWFDEKGKVNQIFTANTALDFDGLKIGDKIQTFKEKFGEPTKDITGETHFKIGDVFISVYYDSETGISNSIYLLAEDF